MHLEREASNMSPDFQFLHLSEVAAKRAIECIHNLYLQGQFKKNSPRQPTGMPSIELAYMGLIERCRTDNNKLLIKLN